MNENNLGPLAYAIIGKPHGDRNKMLTSIIDRISYDIKEDIISTNVNHSELIRKIMKRDYNIIVPTVVLDRIMKNYRTVDGRLIHERFQSIGEAKVEYNKLDYAFTENNNTYEKILNDFISYSSDQFGVKVTKEEARALFANYSYAESEASAGRKSDQEFCFYFFIENLVTKSTSKERDLLEDLSVANIMLSRIIPTDETFDACRFYLDTPVTLKLMGYWGEDSLESYKEITDSIKEKDGKLCIFLHNVKEAGRILDGLSRNFQLGIYSAPNINHYMQALNDYSEHSDPPRLEIDWFTNKLKQLEIEIVEKPDLQDSIKDVRLNEKELEEELSKAFLGGNDPSDNQRRRIQTDIDSLQAVAFLRSQKDITSSVSYADSKHIFITGNRAIVDVVKNKYYSDSSSIMFAENIATLAGNLVMKGKNKLISKYLRLSLSDNLRIDDAFKETLYRTKRQLEDISIDDKYVGIWHTHPNIEAEVYRDYLSRNKGTSKDTDLGVVIEGILDNILDEQNTQKEKESLEISVKESEAKNSSQKKEFDSIIEDHKRILESEKIKNKELLESQIKNKELLEYQIKNKELLESQIKNKELLEYQIKNKELLESQIKNKELLEYQIRSRELLESQIKRRLKYKILCLIYYFFSNKKEKLDKYVQGQIDEIENENRGE